MIERYLPWPISVVTLAVMYLAGNKWPYCWLLGLANQILWITWIVNGEHYGLLPSSIGIIFVYIRNHYKWVQQKKELTLITTSGSS